MGGRVYDFSLIYPTTDDALRSIFRLHASRVKRSVSMSTSHSCSRSHDSSDDECSNDSAFPMHLYKTRNEEEEEEDDQSGYGESEDDDSKESV